MRSLAILLIGLNLAFFYWNVFHRSSPPSGTPVLEVAPATGVNRLVLLSESRPVIENLDVDTGIRCETVGPFTERAGAETLINRLQAQGVTAALQSASREVATLYWVYLPPRPDRAEAQVLAAELADAGVQDFYVVAEGANRHGVSLGLFSEYERARRRVEQLEAMGYGPEIEARRRTQIVYWLDLTMPSRQKEQIDLPDGLNRVERVCPEP